MDPSEYAFQIDKLDSLSKVKDMKPESFSAENLEQDLLGFYSSNFSDFSLIDLPQPEGVSPSQKSTPLNVTPNPALMFVPSLDADISSLSSESPISLNNSNNNAFGSLSNVSASPIVDNNATPISSSETPQNNVNLPEKRKATQKTDTNKKPITKPAPKKPGRKADPNIPENKRKAQNRAAQRAFRERKEHHLKELEQRVEELENQALSTNTENEFLRKQVERLQNELKKYRSGRMNVAGPKSSVPGLEDGKFTFEFPYFKKSGDKDSKDLSPNTSEISSTGLTGTTPLETEDSSSIYSATIPQFSRPSSLSTHSSFSEPHEETFCEQLNLACGNKENPIPKYKTKNPLIISLSDTPSNPADAPSNKSDIFSTGFELDFLSDYKDQVLDPDFFAAQLSDLDYIGSNPLESVSSLPVSKDTTTTNSSTTEHSSTTEVPKPLVDEDDDEDDDDDTVPAQQLMTCTAVWDRISAHPKFADLDIDGLCAELRTKAKCSESGVVLTESDVNKVLSSIS